MGLSDKRLRIGFYYRHIFSGGGYPRDVHRLFQEINALDNMQAVAIVGIRQLWAMLNQVDIVHCFGMFMADLPLAGTLARQHQVPYIVSPLANLMPYALVRSAWKKKLFLNTVGYRFLRQAQAIHAFTESELQAVRQLGIHTPAFKVPLGIYPEDRLPEIPEVTPGVAEEPYFLFLGRLDVAQKGVDILLEGFAAYLKAGGRLNLLICGRDWQGGQAFVERQIEALSLQDRVHFLGTVSSGIKYALMQGAEAFIYPSRFDGPPRPIRDALILGKRILITPESNIHDDIEALGWGYTFHPEPKSLADALFRFESNGNPQTYVNPLEVLSWDVIARGFAAHYQAVYQDWLTQANANGKT